MNGASPRPATPVAIEAIDLHKAYRKGPRALDGLSFEAHAASVFAMLGPNGAGKSTTIKILTTLTRPDSGRAMVAGIDVLAHPERVRSVIGVVGQRPGFDPVATGRENLLLQGELYGITGRRLRQRAAELLERFGLAAVANRPARTYSGGMQRRLDIALGLMHDPQVLFLDEPTTGLDPEARSALWREIARLAGEQRMSILLTTHYLDEADELAAEVAIIDRGRIVAAGSPEALKSALRGDAVHVEVASAERNGDVCAVVERLPGIRELAFDGRVLRARADDGASAMPALLAALHDAGVAVAKVSLSRPSLDDVYLRHAGRAFSEADDAARQEATV